MKGTGTNVTIVTNVMWRPAARGRHLFLAARVLTGGVWGVEGVRFRRGGIRAGARRGVRRSVLPNRTPRTPDTPLLHLPLHCLVLHSVTFEAIAVEHRPRPSRERTAELLLERAPSLERFEEVRGHRRAQRLGPVAHRRA